MIRSLRQSPLPFALPLLLATAVSAAPAAPARGPLPPTSMYLLEGAFTDQRGERVALDVFRGQPVLVGMVYASCPSACPILITRLKKIVRELPAPARDEVRVVLVSLDPKRDTPEKLAELAALHQLDGERWRLLTTGDDTMREVAAVLGVRFRDDGKGAIDHSSEIALLDRDGVITVQTAKLAPPAPELLERLVALGRRGGA